MIRANLRITLVDTTRWLADVGHLLVAIMATTVISTRHATLIIATGWDPAGHLG